MSLAVTLVAGTLTVGLAALGWAWWEARWFVVRRFTVPVLPRGAAPIRVLHLSDLHLVPRQRRKARWVRSLILESPDLVIDTGDNVASDDALPVLLDSLAPLLAVPGVFVNGSNDYLQPRPQNPFTYFRGPTRDDGSRGTLPSDDLIAAFEAAGWRHVGNTRHALVVNGTTLRFVGVDDPHIGRDRIPAAVPDAPGGPAIVRIGIAHAPYARVLKAFVGDGAVLLFAGHTHGGQVRVPGIGALVTNCDLDRRRARGLSGWPGPRPGTSGGARSRWLHVSAGAGTSPYVPLRFACRPEATILVLTGRDD